MGDLVPQPAGYRIHALYFAFNADKFLIKNHAQGAETGIDNLVSSGVEDQYLVVREIAKVVYLARRRRCFRLVDKRRRRRWNKTVHAAQLNRVDQRGRKILGAVIGSAGDCTNALKGLGISDMQLHRHIGAGGDTRHGNRVGIDIDLPIQSVKRPRA